MCLTPLVHNSYCSPSDIIIVWYDQSRQILFVLQENMSRIYFMDGLESLPFSHTEKLTLWFKNRTTISSLELLWRNFELNYPFFVTLILFIDIIGPPFMKALLRSWHRISVNLNSRLRLGLYSTLILTFFSKYVVDCPVCLGSLSSCMTQVQLSFGYQTASNVMSSVWQQKLSWNWVYKGNLWLTQWYQGAQVLWQQNKPKPSHLHHCVGSWNKVGVFSDMLINCPGYRHYGQISKLWCCLSKGTLLQKSCCAFRYNFATLSCAALLFLSEQTFSWKPFWTSYTCSVFLLSFSNPFLVRCCCCYYHA